eukprot:CAMPEP_0173425018 /NCGR_PEP_ID=MMETSP1357-20121228/4824_1 /TAXON_ID=77926 /ORGANISM="Hemiselmis rufescens, Strain PCC563" /LENGTH=57 /DNA_ID=CAMNT_0014388369 /DNA_START=12 /DNA_END=182 /DNA_ORIENTATION=+
MQPRHLWSSRSVDLFRPALDDPPTSATCFPTDWALMHLPPEILLKCCPPTHRSMLDV